MATAGSTGGNNLMTYHEFVAAEQLQQQQATEGEIFELKVCLFVPIDSNYKFVWFYQLDSGG